MVFWKPFFEADERYLSFAVTLIIQIHTIPFSANQIFTVEAFILFRQILEDIMRFVDTLVNLLQGFFLLLNIYHLIEWRLLCSH